MENIILQIKSEKQKKVSCIVLQIFILLLLPFILLLSLVIPILLIFAILLIVLEICIGKYKKRLNEKIVKLEKAKKDLDLFLYENEYEKVITNFYVSHKKKKVMLYDKEFGFSQIVNCELKESNSITQNTIATSNITAFTAQNQYCTECYINVTVDDFKNPNVKLNLKEFGRVSKSSGKYKTMMSNADNAMSVLKLIISKNNEKYVENGIITKVEHRYITEENASVQIERLSQLYKDGVLSEYEFETKKKELLDKVK